MIIPILSKQSISITLIRWRRGAQRAGWQVKQEIPINHIIKELFSHLPPPPSGTPPPKRRRIKIVSLDHLIHYHPVINTFSSSLYTSILKIPVSLLHISSISGEIYFVIWRSFYYSFSKKSGKFSYISKFHILISYKLTIYIVMCFYQGTNQEQKHELSYFLVFLFALPFFLFTCSYFEYFSKSFHTIFILSPRVIVAVIYG